MCDSWNGVVTLTSQNEDMEITDVYELAVYWTDSEKDWYPVGVQVLIFDGALNVHTVSNANDYGVRPVVRIMKYNLIALKKNILQYSLFKYNIFISIIQFAIDTHINIVFTM